MTEDQHISRWINLWPRTQGLPVGPGDDCAVLHPFPHGQLPVWKTDAVVEAVHFRLSDKASAIGHKALARVLSDFAAMGARPLSALITIGIPRRLPPRFIDGCYRGMASLAATWNISLAGGETTCSKELWLSVSGLGTVPPDKLVTRSGAKSGHLLFVTGKLGGSFPKRHLSFLPRLNEGIWLARKGFATAMMDLSDGLGKDLPRLTSASGVSFRLQASALPLHPGCNSVQAVNDGEDYELLFTVQRNKVKQLLKTWPFKTKLSCIGEILPAGNPGFTDGLAFTGYDHFQKNRHSKTKKI